MSKISQTNTQNLVIFAKDVNRLSRFYQEVLHLMVSEDEKSHQLLQGQNVELVIHAIPESVAKSIDIQEPPSLRGFAAIKPAFYVDDLKVTTETVEGNGGLMNPLEDAWEIRGTRVLDGCDPEGNVIQFKCHN